MNVLRIMPECRMRKMILTFALIALTVTAGAQTRDRSQTPDKYKWNLAEIYPSDAAEPRLKVFAFYLDDLFRRQPHTLSDAEERLLADAGPLAGSPSDVFNIFSNADFPYPTVTLSDGKSVKLDQAAFGALRALPK